MSVRAAREQMESLGFRPRLTPRQVEMSLAAREMELSPAAREILERLRIWRDATAAEQRLPVCVVFHDGVLREVASRAPKTFDELSSVAGLSENKLAKYGAEVLAILTEKP